MLAEEEPSFDISKTLLDEFKREAKRRDQKLKDYIDDLLIALTLVNPKIWEEA